MPPPPPPPERKKEEEYFEKDSSLDGIRLPDSKKILCEGSITSYGTQKDILSGRNGKSEPTNDETEFKRSSKPVDLNETLNMSFQHSQIPTDVR
jgi:hypothetical protein